MRDYIYRIKFTGNAGDGIIALGEILLKSIVLTNLNVSLYISYPSSLRSGFSMSLLTISNNKILSPIGLSQLVVIFNPKDFERSCKNLQRNPFIFINEESSKSINLNEFENNHYHSIPFTQLALESTGKSYTKNIIALGVLTHLLNLPLKYIEHSIVDRFRKRGNTVIDLNLKALYFGIEWVNDIWIK